MMQLKSIIIPALLAGSGICLLNSCETTSYNYAIVYAPQEQGSQMQKHTENEGLDIIGPVVFEGSGNVRWWASSYLDVSPKGDQFAYNFSNQNTSNVFLRNAKGGSSTIQRTFRTAINDFAFSSKGDKLAFSDRVGGNLNIFVVDVNSGFAAEQLAATSSDEVNPVFSHDDKKLYYAKVESGGDEFGMVTSSSIWSIDLTTSITTNYTEGFNPEPSPDGSMLYFVRNNGKTGLGEIWSVNLTSGSETQIIASQNKGFANVKVSPNGEWLAVTGVSLPTSTTPTNLDIYLFKTDGSGETQLTFYGGTDICPSWTPDGNKIFFLSERGNGRKGKSLRYNVWSLDVSKITSR